MEGSEERKGSGTGEPGVTLPWGSWCSQPQGEAALCADRLCSLPLFPASSYFGVPAFWGFLSAATWRMLYDSATSPSKVSLSSSTASHICCTRLPLHRPPFRFGDISQPEPLLLTSRPGLCGESQIPKQFTYIISFDSLSPTLAAQQSFVSDDSKNHQSGWKRHLRMRR